MKSYPSISTEVVYGTPVYVWQKADGSNIRIEWSDKRGFYKFGSRKQLLTSDNFILDKVQSLFTQKARAYIENFLKEKKAEKAICYFEFYGQKSFAGSHDPTDPSHKLYLLDIEILGNGHGTGFITQEEFVNKFFYAFFYDIWLTGYWGTKNITPEFEDSIRQQVQSANGPMFEGLVCKSDIPTKNKRDRTVFKIKNKFWIEKARSLHKLGEDEDA